MKKLSFVIPCYGSENTIEYVINEIVEVVSRRSDYDYEIICVNDGSPDNVISVLEKLAAANSKIKVADFAKNLGKHSAVMAGFSMASGDYIVSLDDDGQCPMDRLWDLVDPLAEDKADMTMAEYPHKKQSAFKNFGSRINSLMSRTLINKPKELQFSNFFVMKAYMVEEILRYENPYPYLEGLILRTTDKILGVKMEERERVAGKGHFTFFKSISLLGFTRKQMIDYRTRYNRKQRMIAAGEKLRSRGRPSKKEGELPPSIQRLDKLAQMRYVLASKERYIKRLEMENELMRDFLSHTERK